MSYYRTGTVSPKDMAPEEKGPSMNAASAVVDAPRRNPVRTALVAVATVGFAVVRRRRTGRACDDFVALAADPTLGFDESVLDDIDWTQQNLSTREVELLRLAASADRGRPVVAERTPAGTLT